MEVTSQSFTAKAKAALLDSDLQVAMRRAHGGFVEKRASAVKELPEFETLRNQAVSIKNHVLSNLDHYLEKYSQNVMKAGGHVHWASTSEQAVEIILEICKAAQVRRIAKGKSMIGEEIDLNQALEENGMEVVETDLGEYIIQIAGEFPSHIIAPAIHKTRKQITDLFYEHHAKHGMTERVEGVAEIVNEARTVLRDAFVGADAGIVGANFLVADSGANVLVTNEGNGDLSSSLPRVQIVTASIEKVIPSYEDLGVFLRLLGRSATGQEMSSYTSLYSGAKREEEMDGAEEFHVVLLDNGRTEMLAGEFREMLRCIRCGACMNHCPVYQSIGGHAYGWVYPGPMGSVWTPLLVGLQNAANLPNACTLNGRCEEVCPVRIPLPHLLRTLRKQIFERGLIDTKSRFALSSWSFISQHPSLYRFVVGLWSLIFRWLGRSKGSFDWFPFASGWTNSRSLPAPTGRGFVSRWQDSET